MRSWKQKSKKQAGSTGNFNYIFTLTKDDGTEEEFKITARTDDEAKKLAELVCEGMKISKRRTRAKEVNPAIVKYHLGEHISTICTCGVDYSNSENGGGGNCAHYVCNKDLWKITNQDGIRYNCPSGFGTLASDVKEYCASHSTVWAPKANAGAMTGKGLVFGVKSGKIKHVGIFDARAAVYHYGFTAKKVLKNNISWWETEYDALIFFQKI